MNKLFIISVYIISLLLSSSTLAISNENDKYSVELSFADFQSQYTSEQQKLILIGWTDTYKVIANTIIRDSRDWSTGPTPLGIVLMTECIGSMSITLIREVIATNGHTIKGDHNVIAFIVAADLVLRKFCYPMGMKIPKPLTKPPIPFKKKKETET